MSTPQKFMQRCLDLAQLGSGHVAPNPMVGAVLVRGDKIISVKIVEGTGVPKPLTRRK